MQIFEKANPPFQWHVILILMNKYPHQSCLESHHYKEGQPLIVLIFPSTDAASITAVEKDLFPLEIVADANKLLVGEKWLCTLCSATIIYK